jgi:hypothetical protein
LASASNAYIEKDIRLLQWVNALTREALAREKERLHLLLEVNNTLVTNRDLQLFPATTFASD